MATKTEFLLERGGTDNDWSFSSSFAVGLDELEHTSRYPIEAHDGRPAHSIDTFQALIRCSWTMDLVVRIRVDFVVERLDDEVAEIDILETEGITFIDHSTYQGQVGREVEMAHLKAAVHFYLAKCCKDLDYWLRHTPGVNYAA